MECKNTQLNTTRRTLQQQENAALAASCDTWPGNEMSLF